MTAQRKNLFLYLTLACFLGLIAIFIVDGYMGVYDTLHITTGETEQKIEADFWLQQDRYWSTGVNWGDKAFLRYEVDNRQFSGYATDVEVSIWRSQEKVHDLLSQNLSINAFDKGTLEWVIDTDEFLPADIAKEQSYQYTVIIRRSDMERRVILNINPVAYPQKVPLPVPR